MRKALFIIAVVLPLQAAAVVSGLRTEHLVRPLGIDNPAPRFSWHLDDSRPGACHKENLSEVGVGRYEYKSGIPVLPVLASSVIK